jgi:hypothetical protein
MLIPLAVATALGRQHADQEGLAGFVDDLGLALADEGMGSHQLLIAQAVQPAMAQGARSVRPPTMIWCNRRRLRG